MEEQKDAYDRRLYYVAIAERGIKIVIEVRLFDVILRI